MNGFYEIVSGVHLAKGELPHMPVADPRKVPDLSPPADVLREVEALGGFITSQDFGRAGIDAGKTSNYGQGVMRDIALEMVGIDAEQTYSINGRSGYLLSGTPERERHDTIFYIMSNPDLTKRGSRQRLLLESVLVYDVWRAGEGYPPREYDVPRLGKVGHKIVSMVMLFQPDFVEQRLASEE